jgi:hypothetical protein
MMPLPLHKKKSSCQVSGQFSNPDEKSDRTIFQIITQFSVIAFVIISVLVVFVPFDPVMPRPGLDPSWKFAMNEAVAQHMDIGKDIMFTFGPYASVYTKVYHPATYNLMLLTSLFLGLCYAAALIYLAKRNNPLILICTALFLVSVCHSRDVLFFSYPALSAFIFFKYAVLYRADHSQIKPRHYILLILFLIPVGIIPLIKGSFMILCIGNIIIMAVLLLFLRFRRLAFLVLSVPLISAFAFWVLSGQKPGIFPDYFLSMNQLISGYTEAMSTYGNIKEIIVYLFSSAVILWSIYKTFKAYKIDSLFIGLIISLWLFLAFKGGFVRHDVHAMIASSSILLSSLLICMLSVDKYKVAALLIALGSWAYIDSTQINSSKRKKFITINQYFTEAFNGLNGIINNPDRVKKRFATSLENIREQFPIPELTGTTDIYFYDHSYVLASKNKWNPRPVFQSFSVYTPILVHKNEEHLRGVNAPDNIFFKVQPIDLRLPALDDGLSWPALLDNYSVTGFDHDFVCLHKKDTIRLSSSYRLIYEGQHQLGMDVSIPVTLNPVFIEILIDQNFWGRILAVLYKPPQLRIQVKLRNGISREFRVISNMMKTGFFISPLVTNSRDFMDLACADQKFLSTGIVESFNLTTEQGGSMFWNREYRIRMNTYEYVAGFKTGPN